jgi:3'-phosphoadenosine 5'-phosphosulfate sulfotransferase (PAPS reductase)/FAD synthetase
MKENVYGALSKDNTRIDKSHTVRIEEWYKSAILEQKEDRALWLIETAIRKVQSEYGDDAKIVVSCSFGIDSVVTLHLVRRVANKLGVSFDAVWNNTLNEYPQTRKYAAELTEAWGLNLIEARPDTTLKQVYEKYGVDSIFKRKGDRTDGQPVVEKCCGALKHKPMKKAIKEHGWHLMFNGVRSGESRQRWMSGRRDADFYYSSTEWRLYVARPILWWTALSDSYNYGNNKQEDIWEYVRKYDIPYNPLYDINAVIDDRYTGTSLIVDRETAERLSSEGYNVFMPRTGCLACPIPIKRGYLRYLREVFPKVYRTMLFQLGFARVLIAEMDESERQSILDELSTFGIINEKTEEQIIERLESILEYKPCLFDGVGLVKRNR